MEDRIAGLKRAGITAGACLVLAAAGIVLGSHARAQDAALVPNVSRIRVTAPTVFPSSTSGTLLLLDSDSLRFRSDSGISHALPTGSVEALDRWAGKKGHAAIGMVLGALVGLAVGSAIAPDEASQSYGEDYAKGIYTLGGLAGGLLLGGVIGGSIRSERWERLPRESWRIGLHVLPSEHGLGLSMRF